MKHLVKLQRDANIVRLYVDERMTLRQVGERVGAHPQTVTNVLKAQGVRIRPKVRRAPEKVAELVDDTKRPQSVAAQLAEHATQPPVSASLARDEDAPTGDGRRRAAVIALSRAFLAGQVAGVRP